jgi:hypothetical protein
MCEFRDPFIMGDPCPLPEVPLAIVERGPGGGKRKERLNRLYSGVGGG